MASIDERVVAMSFENAKFEAGVAVTMATLAKLKISIANVGNTSGLENIEKAGQKVTLAGPMSALDKLRARLGGIGGGAAEGFSGIERAGSKVALLNPLTAIDRLRQRLGSIGTGADQGFASIERSSAKVTLAPIGTAIDSINAKFSGMQIAAAGAIAGLTASVATKAKTLGSSLSLGPITGGLKEYATNLNSIQTILANTKFEGAKLKDVNAALQELNTYSDQTIYNFSEMAKNIGTFTAAGVDLKTATASIKGIANLAALSGSNSEQASTAMYQLSQAISSGRVSLQDWNSVVNAGMGGATFQRALVTTAEKMGTVEKGAVKIDKATGKATINGKSFREAITAKPGEKSFLTSEVLTSTLKQFTGDMTDAQLKAQGFTAAQIKSIQETAKTAKNAATQVKTLSGVFDVAKESIGSGWAQTFQLIFGDFEEAKKTFTGLSTFLQGIIGNAADARNKILGDFAKLGGRTVIIDGIKNAFKALVSVIKPVRDAFREIFPRKTGQDLYDLAVKFRDFTKALAIGPETANNLKRSFAGLFAVFHIIKTVISGLIGVVFNLFGVFGGGAAGGLLNFTGSLGDFVVALDKAISKGKGLDGVFKTLTSVLRTPLELLKGVTRAIGGLFGGGAGNSQKDAEKLASTMDRLKKALGPLGSIIDAVYKAFQAFGRALQSVEKFLAPVLTKARDIFSKFGSAIMDGLAKVDYDKVMTFIQTTFLGGLAVGVKKLLGGIGVDFSTGAISNLKTVTSTLTSTLTTIQKNVNAQTMLLIAAAVLALAGAAIIFSQIDAKKLAQAMGAIAVGIGQLVGAMALLTKIGGTGAFLALPFYATSMLIVAAAIDVLAIAIFAFSKLSWQELVKGLVGVGGALVAIGLATKLMGPQLLLIGPGLLPIAFALNLIAVAMKIFGSMKWEEIAKGLFAVGGALTIIGLATSLIGPGLLVTGPGLIAVSVGLILLSGALNSFGSLDLATMGKGLLGIGASLLVIGLAMTAIPPTIALQAAGLILVGIGLTSVGAALKLMATLSIGDIIKSLFVLGASLVILAVGLTAMTGALPGAAALLATGIALAIFVPALALLAQLSYGDIFKGLLALAGILTVLSVAGVIAAAPLALLGAALAVVGVGVIVVATGVYILAKAFTLLGAEGTKGVGIMIAAITALIAVIPKMVIDFIGGIVTILTSLVTLAPKIAESLIKIVTTIVNALVTLVPQGVKLITAFIAGIITTVDKNAVPLIAAGARLLVSFLSGLANSIGPIATAVGKIIVGFLGAITTSLPRLVSAGAHFLGTFLSGINSKLPNILAKGANVIGTFLLGMAQRIPGVISKAAYLVNTFLNSIAKAVPSLIRSGARIIISIINGIGDALPRIIRAGTNTAIKFINGVADAGPRLANAGFRALIHFLNGIAKAIRDNSDRLNRAGLNVASAIGEGMINGLKQVGQRVLDKLGLIVHLMPHKVRKLLGIASPSKVFTKIGKQTMEGMAIGLQSGGDGAVKAVTNTTQDIIDTATGSLSKVPNLLAGITDVDPVITPVLDLSGIQKDAKQLNDLTNVTPITAAASFGQAATISTEQQTAAAAALVEASQTVPVTKVELTQNNHSPEALSDVEIYRQTNNLLSTVKTAVGLPT